MSTHQNMTPDVNNKIDASLRLLAQARPAGGFEQRIHARLQQQFRRAPKGFIANIIATMNSFFYSQRLAFTTTAAALACVAIVIGSVQHSHQRTLPATGVHLSAPGSGLGAASSTHISPQPVIAPEHTRSRSERKATGGRATVSRDAHKPSGVAVPDSTEPQKP